MAKTPDVLAQLRDIHLPEPIHWWPLAPGWYVVISLTFLIIFLVLYVVHKRMVQARPKKQALVLLASYQTAYDKNKDSQQTSARISELLRRVALVYFPRTDVASLHGEEWIKFLTNTSKDINFSAIKDLLLEAPFKSSETVNLQPLINNAKSWIKQRGKPCLN